MESLWDWSERATTLESGKSCIRPSETPLLRKRPEESRIGWPGWYRIVLCSQLPILTWYLWDYWLEFSTSKCEFATQEATSFASYFFVKDSILCDNHIIFRLIGGSHRYPPCFHTCLWLILNKVEVNSLWKSSQDVIFTNTLVKIGVEKLPVEVWLMTHHGANAELLLQSPLIYQKPAERSSSAWATTR